MTFVTWAVFDMAYFCNMAMLNREQQRLFVTQYLKTSNQNASEQDVRDLLFDVEMQKVNVQLVSGIKWNEYIHRLESGMSYECNFTKGMLAMADEAKRLLGENDNGLFNLVCDEGLHNAYYRWFNDEKWSKQNPRAQEDLAHWNKNGSMFPYLEPGFFNVRSGDQHESTHEFFMKEEFQDWKVFVETFKGLADLLKKLNVPQSDTGYENNTFDGGEKGYSIWKDENTKLYFHNWNEDEATDKTWSSLSFTTTVGHGYELPYKSFEFGCCMTYHPQTQKVDVTFRNYQQLNWGADLEKTTVPFV